MGLCRLFKTDQGKGQLVSWPCSSGLRVVCVSALHSLPVTMHTDRRGIRTHEFITLSHQQSCTNKLQNTVSWTHHFETSTTSTMCYILMYKHTYTIHACIHMYMCVTTMSVTTMSVTTMSVTTMGMCAWQSDDWERLNKFTKDAWFRRHASLHA